MFVFFTSLFLDLLQEFDWSIKSHLESGRSGSCWPELRLTRLFCDDEDRRSSHLGTAGGYCDDEDDDGDDGDGGDDSPIVR